MPTQYKGKFKVLHPEKYKGDPNNIIYRSLWERSCMKFFDTNSNVIAWMSEELGIPYISPLDERMHTYYPDFLVKIKSKNGSEKKYLIEVKPDCQTKPPVLPKSNRQTKKFRNALATYAVNIAKWKSAKLWCEKNDYHFKLLTEAVVK